MSHANRFPFGNSIMLRQKHQLTDYIGQAAMNTAIPLVINI